MNKVIIVNLGGCAYQVEDGGYDALRAYLDRAAATLAGNPDRDEIISDIERAIADKFRACLGPNKNVVSTKEVQAVVAEMGPVDDGSDAEPTGTPNASTGATTSATATAESAAGTPQLGQRLFRLKDGAMIAGVCRGLGAYLGLDVNVVRGLFVVLGVATFGLAAVVYVALAVVVPRATTEQEKAAAQGSPVTAREFIRRAQAGYYEAMRGFPDKEAQRAWKRKFKRDRQAWKRRFKWEARRSAAEWQVNWQHYLQEHPRIAAGGWIAWPLLSLCHGLLCLACFGGIVSLLANSTIWGHPLPADTPLWVGIVLLIVVYQLLAWPIKAVSFTLSGFGVLRPHHPSFFGGTWVWLGLLTLLAWLFYPEQTREAIHHIPPLLQQTADAISAWWTRR